MMRRKDDEGVRGIGLSDEAERRIVRRAAQLDQVAATHIGACRGLSAHDRQNIWALFTARREDMATVYRRLEEERAANEALTARVEALERRIYTKGDGSD